MERRGEQSGNSDAAWGRVLAPPQVRHITIFLAVLQILHPPPNGRCYLFDEAFFVL